MQSKINYLAVVVCALLNWVLGMGWFGLFAKPWMAAHGFSEESMANMEQPIMPYVISLLLALVAAWVVAQFWARMGVDTLQDGLRAGAGLGFLAFMAVAVNHMYTMKPLTASLIDGGYWFLLLTAFGAVIGAWQRRGVVARAA
jgi:hypothetical protein